MRGISALCIAASAASLVAAQQLNYPRALPIPIAANASDVPSCADAAWPPSNIGSLLKPQAPDAELREMLSEIDPARIQAIIEKLVSYGTRHTLSQQNSTTRGIGAARDWLLSEFQSLAEPSNGRMTVELQSYIQPVASRILFPTNISNIVATIQGCETPERVYVISGHYDSRCTDVNDYTSDAPGADDDGSGVAIAMELARIVATRNPRSTMIFTTVAGEEQGLYGSNFQAFTYKNSSVDVQGMLDNDIVGASHGDPGKFDPYTIRLFAEGPPATESASTKAERLAIGAENDSPARELGRFATSVAANNATGMNIAVIYRADRYLRGGDHESYLAAGYPAVRFTEPNENFAHQHQNVRVIDGVQYGDLAEFVDYDFTARVGKVNLATMWSQAQAPGWVRNVSVNASVLSNDSLLYWLPNNETGVAGYEVLWRPTDAPLWTHVLPVGNATNVTVPLSKDNVIFGVRAVGVNGYRSPATIPFPVPY